MSTHPGVPTTLTASALDSFTTTHQASPTQTIQSYLLDQQLRRYPVERLPSKSQVAPPPRLHSSPRHDWPRVYEYGSAEAGPSGSGARTALQLVTRDPKPNRPPSPPTAQPIKRHSLVSQLLPRMNKPATPINRPATAGYNRQPLGLVKDVGNTSLNSYSPVIKSRREIQPTKDTPTARTKRVPDRSPSPPPPSPSASRKHKHNDNSNKENIRPTSPPKKRQRASTATRQAHPWTRKRVKIVGGSESGSSSVDPYQELAARQFVPTSTPASLSAFPRCLLTAMLDADCRTRGAATAAAGESRDPEGQDQGGRRLRSGRRI